jgi:hydroxyacylglutathione hydrolase
VGYERIANWALATEDEDEFVRTVLAGQPEPPRYFAEMKRINKQGPRVLGGFASPQRLPDSRLAELLAAGALVVDTRSAADFAARHVPGTINIPLDKSFSTWAGWLVPFDRDFHLMVDDRRPGAADEAMRDLSMIGLDRLAGYFGSGAIDTWVDGGGTVGAIPQITVVELRARLGGVTVLDVRGRGEWDAGHLPGAQNIPLGYLADHLVEVRADETVVLQCQSGARSAIASSVLRAHGRTNVVNLAGGYAEWHAGGNPVERASASTAGAPS